ncbi:DUF91 domain-containing protein, partial [Vibrio vulnificus]|nr:DUF91 domain-containing protein [Vibrio vulnificus]
MTNNLRVIQHAWHFWFGLSLVIRVVKLRLWLRASHLN